MTKSKFTKGDLIVENNSGKAEIVKPWGGSKRVVLATLHRPAYHEDNICGDLEAFANARLYAAAPDLYEAIDHPLLRELFGMIEDSGTPEATKLWIQAKLSFDVREEAMRKARGEQ